MLTGCNTTTCFVLNQDEVVIMSKGDQFTAPYDGTYYSTRAEKRVMNVKKIKANLK